MGSDAGPLIETMASYHRDLVDFERRPAGEQFKKRATEGIDVRGFNDPLAAAPVLRGHIGVRPHLFAVHSLRRFARRRVFPLSRRATFRRAEASNIDLAGPFYHFKFLR